MTEEELFHAALATPRAKREDFLNQACAGNEALRKAVEALLAAHEAPGSLLNLNPPNEEPIQDDLAATRDFGPGAGAHVGGAGARDAAAPQDLTANYRRNSAAGVVIARRYTLQEKIGEGGMGEVWSAKQTEPIKRKVAVKLIRPGMDSRAVMQRFEHERQALALMDHPNIARVLDGGMTADGQPYFVMELVNGLQLNKFCDELKLSPKERLELFVPICQAVQHAHQKGIVHRDLKPANILVTMIDGKPVPKVIDFGVAKATAGKLTDETMTTDFGAVVGTLEYMSPEQAGYSGEDIDTRADIYSLGVILYELLTGLRPIDAKRLRKAALTEMIRIIREEEPSKPSTRLSTEESLPSLAAARHTEPRKLTALLRGELDWVVMKCLEKQRERRYETANGLARDIQRYLADEVVEARPPSAGYRIQKFVRKHKGQAIAASLVLLALVGGVVGTSIGMLQARRANIALEGKNEELEDEKEKVQARFELAQKAIATFHTGVSEDALLKNEQFTELRTKLLKEAAGFYGDLEKLLEGQADTKSRKLLAEGYFQLGGLTKSIGDQPAALAVFRKALDLQRELASEPEADIETKLTVAKSLLEVGRLLDAIGETDEAIRAHEEQREVALALEAESQAGEALELAGKAYNRLGTVLLAKGRQAEAQSNYEKAVEVFQKLTETHPSNNEYQAGLAQAHINVGVLLRETERPVESLAALERSLAIRQKMADANLSMIQYQTDLAVSLINIGFVLRMLDRPEEGLEAYEKGLAVHQKLVDAQPAVNRLQSDLASSYYYIALLLGDIFQPDRALEAYGKALAIQQRLADANPAVTDFQFRLAINFWMMGKQLSRMGQRENAIAALDKARAVLQKLSDSNPALIDFLIQLASTELSVAEQLFQMGRPVEALATDHQARARLQKLVDANPTLTSGRQTLADVQNSIGYMLTRIGQPAEALPWFEKSLAIRQKLFDTNKAIPRYQSELATSFNNIGRVHALAGRFPDAFAAFDTAVALRQELAETHPTLTQYNNHLGYSYAFRGWAHARAGQTKEAAVDLKKALELFARDKALDTATRFEKVKTLAVLAGLGGDAESGVTTDESEVFAEQSISALKDAIAAGWANRVELQEPDFDVLRNRADFQKLVSDLNAQATMPVKAVTLSTDLK